MVSRPWATSLPALLPGSTQQGQPSDAQQCRARGLRDGIIEPELHLRDAEVVVLR